MYLQHDFRVHQDEDECHEDAADDEDDGDDEDDKSSSCTLKQTATLSSDIDNVSTSSCNEKSDLRDDTTSSNNKLVLDISDMETCEYLQISTLNEWDYPIFDASSVHRNSILSKVGIQVVMHVDPRKIVALNIGSLFQRF